jgi:CBS domain-containing protein
MNVATILKDKGRMVVSVKPETTLLEAAQTLAAHRIGAAVVVSQDGKLEGIVSERDIVRAVAGAGAQSLNKPLSQLMTRDVRTCRDSDTIDHVMQVMTHGRFRHLPVLAKGELQGIVSIGDVVKLKIAETELEVAAMRDYIKTG